MRKRVMIDWSYSSSAIAERFGYKKTGCWTVLTVDADGPLHGPTEAVSGHESKREAVRAALRTGLPLDPLMLQYRPGTVKMWSEEKGALR